jgi:hypothetical protein
MKPVPIVLTLALASSGCAAASSQAVVRPGAARVNLIEQDLEVGYLCPMHPDHTSDEPGKCPRCGMALVLGRPFDMRDYRLDFQTEPELPTSGEPLTLRFAVSHPDNGETVRDFELVHDMPYHLFVISQDMEYFQHIHPAQGEDGIWSIEVVLPRPGAYVVLSDFMPKGGSAQFLARPLVTTDYTGGLLSQTPELVPDTSATKTVDNLRATVSYDPPVLRAGSYGHVTFRLTRADTNELVRDLQPYLGAFGHMLIMDGQLVDYVHAHPIDLPPADVKPEDLKGGPEVVFEGLMPKPGLYRAWTQFRYQDTLHTFTSTFRVYDVGERVSP